MPAVPLCIQVVPYMNFVTRSEFRECLLSLFKDVQKLRQGIDKSNQKEKRSNKENQRVAVDVKFDPISSVETRTPRAEQKQERRYQRWSLGLQFLTLAAVAWYACEASRQSATMNQTFQQTKRQVEDFEVVQAANITFGQPQIKLVASGKQFQLDFTLVLRNSGPSAAYQVQIEPEWGFGGSIPAESTEKPKAIMNGGISMGPNETRTIHQRINELISEKELTSPVEGHGRKNHRQHSTG